MDTRPIIHSDHIHHHHLKGILVMLGFTVAQFFFMSVVVDAGEMTLKALLDCTNIIRTHDGAPNAANATTTGGIHATSSATTGELLSNDLLAQAAQNKLADMAHYQYWAHQNHITGQQPWDFIDASGYRYATAGENLAYGYSNSQDICDAWEKSPKHLANIIDPTFRDVGFAVDKANLHKNEKGILVVQMFGSRSDTSTGHPSANPTATTAAASSKTVLGTSTTTPDPTSSDHTGDSVKPSPNTPTAGSSQPQDSVHPQSSALTAVASALPYAIAIALAGAITAWTAAKRFKKLPKKAKMEKTATMASKVAAGLTVTAFALGILALILFLFFSSKL